MVKLLPIWPPSGHNSRSKLQQSSLLTFSSIVLLCTHATCSFAWTSSSRVQSKSSHLQSRHQNTLLGDDNNQVSVGNNNAQWQSQNRMKFKSRRRNDVTQLFASSDNDYVNGDQEMNGEAAIMEIADALTATTTESTLPATEMNGYVQQAEQAWTIENESDGININTNNNNVNGVNDEEANYMALAKEAWTQFFSDQISEEEFLNMALDAWTDASLIPTNEDGGVGSQSADEAMVVEMEEDFDAVKGSDEEILDDNTTMESSEKQWGINTGVSFLSGLFSGFNKPSDNDPEKSIDEIEEDDVPYGLRQANSFVEGNEEDVPYGLRMKSSSQPPPSTSSTTDPVKNTMGAMKGKSDVKDQTKTSPQSFKKSDTPQRVGSGIMKGKETTVGKTSKLSSMPPPSFKKSSVKVGMGDMKGKSDVEDQTKTSPLSLKKDDTLQRLGSGITKGKETAAGKTSKLSSMPPPSFKKSGVKVGVQSKLAPKKFAPKMKKRPQGKRGGLSFLNSEKLSNGYKPSDKKYNPMSKGVTPVKIKSDPPDEMKMVETDQVSTETVNESNVVNVAKTNALNLSPATELISDGMTADEAERIRSQRLLTEEEKAITSESTAPTITSPTAIAEGMTAEEAESARSARLEVSIALNQTQKKDTLFTENDHLGSKIKINAGSDPKATNLIQTVGDLELDIDARSDVRSVPISKHIISDGMTAEEAEGIRLSRLQSSVANITPDPVDEKILPEVNATAITEGMTAEEAEQARQKRLASNIVRIANSTNPSLLITDGMTAEEAERVRKSRLQSSVANIPSETIQPELSLDVITEGMTAEEAEQARLKRYNSIAAAADSIGQDSKKKEKASTVKEPPQCPSLPVETTESRQLREKITLLEAKFESVVDRMNILETRIEGLDRENLQLRQDNVGLRRELDEVKQVVAMEDRRSSSIMK